MKQVLAYLGVLLMWSTTPLGLKWSSEGVTFLFAAASRMILAAMLSLLLVWLIERRLPIGKLALKSYGAGAIGLFAAMACIYWAAQFLSSGMIAVLFGLTPLFTGAVAYFVLGEHFGWRKFAGVVLSLLGLAVIFLYRQSADFSWWALVIGMGSPLLFSVSAVLVKYLDAPVSSLQQTTGALLVAAVGYIVWWLASGEALPQQVGVRTWASLAYLVVVCSVLGFFLYYYMLEVTSAGAVSLITLITPVNALLLGLWINAEQITWNVVIGVACIGAGLLVYQWGVIFRMVRRKLGAPLVPIKLKRKPPSL